MNKRKTSGYYLKSLKEREDLDKARVAEENRAAGETQAAEEKDDDKKEDDDKTDDKADEKTEEEKKKEEEAAKPKAGEENFRCEKSGDTRPECNDGLCCGAAKKEGGTDVIESCQKKDMTVYKYKKDKDAKEEDWAFACIEGARSLTASATAVLAAAYMLA